MERKKYKEHYFSPFLWVKRDESLAESCLFLPLFYLLENGVWRGGTLDKMIKSSSSSRQKEGKKNHDQNRKGKKGVLAAVSPSGIGVEKYISRSHVSFPGKNAQENNAGHICHFFVLSCCVFQASGKREMIK